MFFVKDKTRVFSNLQVVPFQEMISVSHAYAISRLQVQDIAAVALTN